MTPRTALLPWESEEDFEGLHHGFRAEFAPVGASETALVDRLVWIEWRRRRLALAERAAHVAAMRDRVESGERVMVRVGLHEKAAQERLDLTEVVASDEAGDQAEVKRATRDRRCTAKAIAILDRGGANAYERARASLFVDTANWWADELAGEYDENHSWTPTAESLGAFLRTQVQSVDRAIERANAVRGAVRVQLIGESVDPKRLESLLALDARLDRQFDKALSTLIQLQEVRRTRPKHAQPSAGPKLAAAVK